MSIVAPTFNRSTIVRNKDAELVGAPNAQVRLIADSSMTGGALTTVLVSLTKGTDGARPH